MAITDLQISDTLETSAPSIKYTGNEGPQAPQQMASANDPMADANDMSMQLFGKPIHQLTPPELELFQEEMERLKNKVEAPQQSGIMQAAQGGRIGYAGGGIMGSNNGSMLAARTADGSRPKYGFLDKIKSRVRKLIPNEVSRVAEVAAPFVAPFNPLAAGLMSGIGGFDRHGSLGKGLKSGLMNYGMGQGARYLGGAGFQGAPEMMGGQGLGGTYGFSSPLGSSTGLGKMFADKSTTSFTQDGGNKFTQFTKDITNPADTAESLKLAKEASPNNIKLLDKFLGKAGLNTAAMAGIVGASALAGIYTAKNPADDSIKQMRGEGLDIEGIRREVVEAFKEPSGKLLAELRIKYPFLGAKETKNIDIMAEGGRIGLYAGGQSIPSPYTMEDARKSSMQDKMGGITDVMKRADLARQGDVGQMYMAEGGLMDMGGMEKDYRNDGGFVPIGGKEKADDVPARLSRNEFVFTADAVRGAGGGDIDKGAEIMENIMVNLEQGGRMSKKSQGLGGAQEMFDVSERIGEVI